MFGKKKSGRVRCYGKTMTPQHWRKIKKIDALKREHAIERNDMVKKFEGFEAVMKFVAKYWFGWKWYRRNDSTSIRQWK